MLKQGAPRICLARRAGLRHMLVILNIRHEDGLFSKINKFASLTSVEVQKNGKNKRCVRCVPLEPNRRESSGICLSCYTFVMRIVCSQRLMYLHHWIQAVRLYRRHAEQRRRLARVDCRKS